MSFSYDEWMRKGWQREPKDPYKEACEFLRQHELAYADALSGLVSARQSVQSYKKEIEVALFGYDGFCEDGIVQIIVNYLV